MIKMTNADQEISKRIRAVRISKGKSRFDLAKNIGVTHQQIQKYENGINRVSAGMIKAIASYLKVPIGELIILDKDQLNDVKGGPVTYTQVCKLNKLTKSQLAGVMKMVDGIHQTTRN